MLKRKVVVDSSSNLTALPGVVVLSMDAVQPPAAWSKTWFAVIMSVTVPNRDVAAVAKNPVEISDSETDAKAMKLLNALDDLDDVTNVHTNADITAEI